MAPTKQRPGADTGGKPTTRKVSRGYPITPAAEAELLRIAGEIGIAPAALVDLAVRTWCSAWRGSDVAPDA